MEKTVERKDIFLIALLIFLNAVKLTVFNFVIMPAKTPEAFLYKAFVAVIVFFLICSFLLKLRSAVIPIVLYIAEAVYIFSYMSYYTYFGNYLHLFQAAALFTEGVGPIRHFTIPVNFSMLVILLDLPVFIWIVVRYKKIGSLFRNLKKPLKILQIASLLLLACLETWNFAHGISLFQLDRNFYKTESKIIERYGTFVNNLVDITVNYGGENMIRHFAYGKTVTAFAQTSNGSSGKSAGVSSGTTGGKSTGSPNIIAIQVESMDAHIVNQQYNGRYVTPYLHSIAQNNIYYPYVLSYHKSGGTSDSEFSILNSIEPLGNYPSIKIPKYTYPNSFVKVLDRNGYYTMAFHGNTGNYYNRDVAFAKMGFDVFYDKAKMKLKEEGWGVPDSDVFNFTLDKAKKQKSPFFAYVITMSSHMPFTNVSNYYTNNRYSGIADETVRHYFNSFSYVDRSIRDFVQKIQKDFPNTVILIWGDHTPGINSPDYRQASFTNGSDYYEFVPFIMVTPDHKTHRESTYAASFLDICPTILYETGTAFTVKTDGINLAASPAVQPKIPFKEKLHDRKSLFDEITRETKAQKAIDGTAASVK